MGSKPISARLLDCSTVKCTNNSDAHADTSRFDLVVPLFFFLFIHVATPTLIFVSDLIQGHNAISRFEDGRDK